MPLSNIVQNVGIGKVEATLLNQTTTLALLGSSATPFRQADIDAYHRGAVLLGNNTVGHTISGSTTQFQLFGAVQAVSEDLQAGKAFPLRCVVQVSGFADIMGTTGQGGAPIVMGAANRGHWLTECAGGCVALMTTTMQDPQGGNVNNRGLITEVYDTQRCVVLF